MFRLANNTAQGIARLCIFALTVLQSPVALPKKEKKKEMRVNNKGVVSEEWQKKNSSKYFLF